MSTNIWLFKYLNKMALEYHLSLHLCHFPSTSKLGYSFVDFWKTEYIWIFVRKFLDIRIYLNIFSEPCIFACRICSIPIYSDICSVHNVASKYIQVFVRVHFIIFAHHWSLLFEPLMKLVQLQWKSFLNKNLPYLMVYVH